MVLSGQERRVTSVQTLQKEPTGYQAAHGDWAFSHYNMARDGISTYILQTERLMT